jgi:hypothetical protein
MAYGKVIDFRTHPPKLPEDSPHFERLPWPGIRRDERAPQTRTRDFRGADAVSRIKSRMEESNAAENINGTAG